jgi:hypothetical protein
VKTVLRNVFWWGPHLKKKVLYIVYLLILRNPNRCKALIVREIKKRKKKKIGHPDDAAN